ncbi:unnamed protein product [Polarella glacialis]|uniref:Uncharacterized protein n=1 Tax=Polarella glacialis TaxID=89957 RepID=A0A813J5N9_POLGL|nr:unnamed protein product [Polarella glacialis]
MNAVRRVLFLPGVGTRRCSPLEVRTLRTSCARLSEATPVESSPSTTKVDIAHKACGSTGSSYGYSKKIASSWDRIFAKKGETSASSSKESTTQASDS